MKDILNIVTVNKDDLDGVAATVQSTKRLRACTGVSQIIVDSSADPVPIKIKEILVEEKNIEYFWQEPSGISAAFNLGVNALNSEWAWFLNSRDEVHSSLDENLLLQILNSTRADVVIFQIEYMGSQLQRPKNPPLWLLWPPMYRNWVPHPATFIRTGLFKKYGVFDTDFKIAMDADLWMRMFSKDVVVDMLSIPAVLYDIHGISATNTVETDKEARRIIRKNIGMLVRKWLGRGVHLLRAFTKL